MIEETVENLSSIAEYLLKPPYATSTHRLELTLYGNLILEVGTRILESEQKRKVTDGAKFCYDPRNKLPSFEIHIERLNEIAESMFILGHTREDCRFLEKAEEIRQIIYKLKLGK